MSESNMQVQIFDTMKRAKVPVPNKEGNVGIYVCGLTVYDRPHLGHARVFVVFDVLRRVLANNGYSVKYVQNFTDVDDRIIARARDLGTSAEAVADKYIAFYFEDMHKLNVMDADVYPRATQHVREIEDLISKIEQRGYAYTTSSGVYFRVQKFQGYGKLSHQSIENLKKGARIEPDPEKEDPLDFSLWKFYKGDPAEPHWESPWGDGRPGWHIECSAMSMKYLDEIDIHGGGEDLIFPHHENEIAQSESATGKTFALSWMHVGLLNIGGEKMSKSLKNFITIGDAVARWGPNSVRLFLLSAPYRAPLTYTEELMEAAANNWLQIETSYAEALCPNPASSELSSDELPEREMKLEQNLLSHLSDDLNTPVALSDLNAWSSFVARVASARDGLSVEDAKIVRKGFEYAAGLLGFTLPQVDERHRDLVEQRFLLRHKKQFAEADKIRQALWNENVILIDHKDHTVWFESSVPNAVRRIARLGEPSKPKT
ncbi:cysteine--tRNA ligase [Tardisphaera saccharovorans]